MTNIKETLFDLFQLDKMPIEKGVEMLDRLSTLVFQSTLIRVLPMLSEEDLTEYEEILKKEEGGDVLFVFLSKKIPELDKIIQEESELLKMELAGKLK